MKFLTCSIAVLLLFSQCQQAPQTVSNPIQTATHSTAQELQNTPSVNGAESINSATSENPTAAQPQNTSSNLKQVPPSVSQSSNSDLADLPLTDVALLYKNLLPTTQTYDVEGKDIVRINCKGGTVLLVKPLSFEYEDGTPVKGSITIKVTEYLQRGDMLYSPITTMTQDNKPLETAGMIYTYAFANSKRVRLKRGEEIRIGFRVTDDERFQLFDGAAEQGSNLVQWSLAREPMPVSEITHNEVSSRPRFAYGNIEEYITKNISRTSAMKKYKGEGFTIAAFVTVNKKGKVVAQRLAENKELFMDLGMDTAFMGLVKRMPQWLPAFKKGKPVQARALVAFNFSGFRDESAQVRMVAPEDYAHSMNLKADQMLATTDDDILYFPSKQLGWINCDRFYNDPRPKSHILVDAGGQAADVKLIFKEMNAIMNFNRTKERQFRSPEVPIGEAVLVVGVKKEGTQFYYGMQETTADNKTIALAFQPISEADLKAKIKELNH